MELSAELSKLGVILIDDFHLEAMKIRNLALSQDYKNAPSNDKPGGGVAKRVHCNNEVLKVTVDKVARTMGIIPSMNAMEFRYSTINTHKKAVCHTDMGAGQYSGFIYLTLPEHCQGGTSFFLHKDSGATSLNQNNRSLASDYRNPDAWELLATVEMKFNRCIILPSNLFHSVATPYFGESIENARLTQVFWFSKAKATGN
jgi:hypothetical protein